MEELKEDKQIELRSEEVQEIMGQVPPWIQRWDITVMAFLMVLFLGISWFTVVECPSDIDDGNATGRVACP